MSWGSAITAGVNATNGLIGNFFALGMNKYNNEQAAERAAKDREENYLYNEMAAKNADARTRALYNDLYSPQAQMQQIKDAGLSPSMMAGGLAPGAGGASGAQGSGTAGVQTPYYGLDPMTGAQIAKTLAETDLIRAETKKTDTQITMQDIANKIQDMEYWKNYEEFQLITKGFTNSNGEQISLNELANSYNNFEDFLKYVRDVNGYGSKEIQVNTLRKVYTNARKVEREVAVLSSDKVDAEFYMNVLNELSKQDYAALNAEDAAQLLNKSIATNKLDETQKNAWNDLLDKIGQKSETGKDILIVIMQIIDRVFSAYGKTNLNFRKTNADITHHRG